MCSPLPLLDRRGGCGLNKEAAIATLFPQPGWWFKFDKKSFRTGSTTRSAPFARVQEGQWAHLNIDVLDNAFGIRLVFRLPSVSDSKSMGEQLTRDRSTALVFYGCILL